MVLRQPSWFQSASHPAENDRNVIGSIVSQGGVAGPYDLVPSLSATGGMRVSFSAGSVFCYGAETWQGVYHCINDDVWDVPLAGANATLPRLDYIVARVQDPDYGASGSTPWDLVPLTGVPAQVPDPPTAQLQPGDEVIALVRVDKAVTNLKAENIVSKRRLVRLRSAQTVATQADRDNLVPYDGMVVYRTDKASQEWYQGGTWYAPVVADAASGAVRVNGNLTVAGNGTARTTTDFLTVGGDASVGGVLSATGGLQATKATISGIISAASNIVTGGTFVDRFGRDILTLIGSGGLTTDTKTVDTAPSARPVGLYLTPNWTSPWNCNGVVLTAVLGPASAVQVFVSTSGALAASNPTYVNYAFRAHNSSGNGTWGPWRAHYAINGQTNGSTYYGDSVSLTHTQTGSGTLTQLKDTYATVSASYQVDGNGWCSGFGWAQINSDWNTQGYLGVSLPQAASINAYVRFSIVGDYEYYRAGSHGGRVLGHLEVAGDGGSTAYFIAAAQDLVSNTGVAMGGNGTGVRMLTDLTAGSLVTWRYGYYIY